MALGAPEFTELVASTLERIEDGLWDQVHTRHPALDWLSGKEQSATGRKLQVNLELAEDTSTQFTDKSGTFSTAVSNDVVGSALFDWSRPMVSSVRLRWQDIKENQGDEQVVDLVKTHINAMKKAHRAKLVEALHARKDDNTGSDPDELTDGQFLSLDELIADSSYDGGSASDFYGGTRQDIGGIDSSSQSLWQSTRKEFALDGSGDADFQNDSSSADDMAIRRLLREVSNDLFVNTKSQSNPNKMIAGRDIFQELEDSFDEKVRYPDPGGSGQTRFNELMFGDITVRLDPDCPSRRFYLFDSDLVVIKSLAGTFMEQQESQQIEGTFDRVTPVASVLAIGIKERRSAAAVLRPTSSGSAA